tara:strand:- start:1708 stop:2256 length:549 start_codon:yes stop_codon:yes gene_type:complete
MNKKFRKFFLQMIHYKLMRYIFVILLSLPLLSVNLNAEYEMHIPNCTQKGVENCGGFLFDNETGDVLFCGSESCIDLKLPKSWKAKQKDKLSKQDQILEMLSNIQVGSVNTVQNVEPSSDTKIVNQEVKSEEKKEEKEVVKKEEKKEKKIEKCDKEKKSLCKGSGGMQLGGTGMKLKKPTKK